MLVAFICMGNICRSPMAEAFARTRHHASGVSFVSAGTAASRGLSASRGTVDAMAAAGISVNGHRTRALDDVMKQEPDLIFAMERTHVDVVRRAYPHLTDRVMLLDPDGKEVPDPYGRDYASYEAARDLIAGAVARRAPEWTG